MSFFLKDLKGLVFFSVEIDWVRAIGCDAIDVLC